MKEYRVERDGKKDLAFKGEILASVSSWSATGPTQNRWDEYTLYKTEAGKYVLSHEYHTQWQGENDTAEAWTGDSAQSVLENVGFDEIEIPRLIKQLAEEAGIDISERIE